MRELMQKRDAIVMEMSGIMDKAEAETRALNDDERTKFEELEAELKAVDATINAKRALEGVEKRELDDDNEPAEETEETTEEAEERAFADFLRSTNLETRADVNMTLGDNGAVIPQSIANRIITKIEEISPIYADAEHFNIGGKISIPLYDDSTNDITVGFVDEFTTGESNIGKFVSISLEGHLIRAIADISRSLINNSDFDIVGFVVNRMALKFAQFIEDKVLNGASDGSKTIVEGFLGIDADHTITAAATSAVTADELIDLQESIPDKYKEGAYFIMASSTRAAIRKLKDGQGNLLLNPDATSRWGYRLLGSNVYVSDSMSKMETGKNAVYFVNPSGVAIQMSEAIEVEVLNELKAQQHAREVIGFAAFDAKIQDKQKVAVLKMA